MCNRFRGLKEWSEIPRQLARARINFDYHPNVAPTEQVPAFLAERGKPLATRLARFGIALASSGGKKPEQSNRGCRFANPGYYEDLHSRSRAANFSSISWRPSSTRTISGVSLTAR
jgi:hypothetical protein